MSNFSHRVTDWLVRWRWPLLLVGIVVAAVSWPASRKLSFDRAIENMFADNNPLLPPFRRLNETFGGNEIVLAVYEDDQLLAPDRSGIRRLASIADRIELVPGVAAVLSLDRLLVDEFEPDDFGRRGYLPLDSDMAKGLIDLFEGYTHGADGRTAAVVCMMVPSSKTKVSRHIHIDLIRQQIENLPDGLSPGILAGEPVMVTEGFRLLERDGRRLGVWSTILLAVIIVACFRSIRWVLIPVAVVQWTLLVTQAVLYWCGLQLTMVSSMLTAIVTVVGIATVMHVIVRYRDARQSGLDPRGALLRAGGLIAAAIFWACSTDAAGFAALQTARVGPIHDFGLMMAIGSLLVIAGMALLVPGLALLLSGVADDPRRVWGEGLLDAELGWTIRFVERHTKPMAVVLLSVGVLAAAGISFLQAESDFTRNFRQNSPLVKSYAFVEERLGGAGVWDVVLPAPKELSWEYVNRIVKLGDRLRADVVLPDEVDPSRPRQPGLTKVISLADAIKLGVDVEIRAQALLRFVPKDVLVGQGLRQMRDRLPAFVDALYNHHPDQPNKNYFRVMLRARERQSAERKQDLIDQVRRIVREEFPADADAASAGGQVTGYFVLLANLIDSVLSDQWYTFGVAAIAITVMMCLALRDLRLALIALVPNALPVLMVMGAMGWIGLKINMGAAMIAAVSLGLSVDSSIHYLTSFQRARRAGKSMHDALTEVEQTVGRAIVFSTMALIFGFLVLTTSEFVPTVYFGSLVSLAMAGGLAGNLIVLPVLMNLFMNDDRAGG